ncbi:zinc-dependent peptidase [Aquimonas sp.]|jgi:Mlc titration factor MtfA (ptsG expression regulator)|uniref:M90 family metallopeptidase n=1 Tax=Aquimonas sp. TaxID=1872588 RepID=UPI0037BEDED4
MLSAWWQRRRNPDPLSPTRWNAVCERAAVCSVLDASQVLRLRGLAGGFLQRKSITPVQGLELDDDERALIATLCCLPVLNLGGHWLGGWREVVMYPSGFRVRRQEIDEPTGVLHEWDEDLAGEAWSEGPLILSWEDLQLDLDHPESGMNIVAHEVAHKLDLRDGVLDGTPPLPAARLSSWVRDLQAAFAQLNDELDASRETLMDPYAAESPEEFFAVVSEVHFSAPALLQQAMPAVAAQLTSFYGESPWARLPATDESGDG